MGAGLGGLALARTLRDRGFETDVVERAPAASDAGAGMFLPANAVRALGDLGLGDAVRERGHRITRMRVRDQRGRTLVEMPFTAIWGDTGDCLAVRRPDLNRILADGVPVRYGVAVRDARAGLATFADGSSRQYDLVVGADGIRSTVRAGDTPRPVGLIAWRFLAEGFAEDGAWSTWQARGQTFLAVSLGGGHAYCYADAFAPLDWPRAFAGFADPVPALAAQGSGAHFGPIEEVGPALGGDGRTVLVGDAAHAFSPNMAQGAAMAFEDAIILADLLERHPPAEAVHAYGERRAARIAHVRDKTRQRDHTRHLPPAVRNAVLRLAGRRIIPAQFRLLRSRP